MRSKHALAPVWLALETLAYIQFRFRLYKFTSVRRFPTTLPSVFLEALLKNGEARRLFEIYKKRYILITMDQFMQHMTGYTKDILAEVVGSHEMSVTYKPLVFQLSRQMYVYFSRWKLLSRGFTSRILYGEYRMPTVLEQRMSLEKPLHETWSHRHIPPC